jgi:hypothetical protein
MRNKPSVRNTVYLAVFLSSFATRIEAQDEAPTTEPTPTAVPSAEPAAPAVAQPADGAIEARRRYAQGSEFYRRARYAEAVAEFTEAYSLWQNPTILYALGQAYEGMFEVDRAIESYTRYLETAPADDLRRGEVTAKIAELEGLYATIHIAANVTTSVYVDGEARGEAPGDFRVATGRHRFELRASGYESQSATVTVAGGTERTLTFDLAADQTQVVRVERERFRFPRPVFYTAVGLTAAGLVTWGALATTSVVRANDYNDDVGNTNFDRHDAREVARRSNVVLAVTGGVAVTTAVIGLLTRWDASDDPTPEVVTASIDPIAGGAIVSARWTR